MKLTQVRLLSVKMVIVLTIAMLISLALNGQVMAQSSQIQGARDNTQVYSGVVYGPIDQSDTLWRIASRYKKDARFSVYQVMLAIYELNPQAFENGNFNTMVNGATLRLPSDRYIARTDVQKARVKAEQDDRLFGRQNSVQSPSKQANTSANSADQDATNPVSSLPANLKPDIPLVNQNDLSKTQSQLQTQLNGLRRQQQQQFEALKNQVAASINSVETLLDENRKLNERLLQIDENNRNLTQTVETELQVQIDQQVAQLNQLIDLVKNAEQRRIDEESKSILAILSSNTAIILISSALTLIVLIAFGIFLLRRTGPANAPVIESVTDSKKSEDIVDEELVIGELDDEIDQDSDDLLAALEQDTASQDDDILSDELENDDAISSLSEDELGADFDMADEIEALDDFADVDDMLVPDSPESIDVQVSEDNNENLDFDSTSLDQDDVLEDISLEDEFSAEHAESATAVEIDVSEDIDLSDDPADTVEEEFESEDTSNPVEPDIDDGSPVDIGLDENGDIDEDTLDQIEQKIEEKDLKINSLADELLEELDAGSSDDANAPDEAELADQQDEAAQQDEADQQDEPEQNVDQSDIDALLDGVDESIDTDIADKALSDETSSLSDELIADLEEENQIRDELDQLLENDDSLAIDEEERDLTGNLDEELDAPDDQVNALADELLQELESEEKVADELDSLLNEEDEASSLSSEDISSREDETNIDSNVHEDVSSLAQVPSNLDADDLLDDIPSFTNVLTDDDELEGDTVQTSSQDTQSDALTNEESSNEPISLEEPIEDSVSTPLADAEHDGDEQSESNVESEEEQDVLSSLPDLDDWLDEEEPEVENAPSSAENERTQEQKKTELDEDIDSDFDSDFDLLALEIDDIDVETSLDTQGTNSDEDDLIKGLDDANFDEMLNELADEADIESEVNADMSETSDNELTQAGLDIEALMTEDNKQGASQFDKALDSDDLDEAFVDVDELLKESDAMPQMQDSDIDLDLERSLDQFVSSSDSEKTQDREVISDDENDQASNLDLAQVYIDMEDFEAAQELLDEVKRKGTDPQKSEADSLIARFKN